MTRIQALLFVLCLCMALSIGFVYAEGELPSAAESTAAQALPIDFGAAGEDRAAALDLDSMTVDALLRLKDEIDRTLDQKGYKVYFDLERNDKGEDVSRVQTRLTELGFYSGKITGKFDTETQKAFKLFEKKNQLNNDGNASAADQRVLFSNQAVGNVTVTAAPKVTATPIPEKYKEFEPLDYGAYARNPENYRMQKVKLVGKVVQVLGDRQDGFQVRLATAGNEDVVYVFINEDPGYNILENDRLTVYALMWNTVTYTTVRGDKVTIPAAYAQEVELR